jgi:Transcriptional regulators
VSASSCFAVARNRSPRGLNDAAAAERRGGADVAPRNLYPRPASVRTIGVFLNLSPPREGRPAACASSSLFGAYAPGMLTERSGAGDAALRGIRAMADRRNWRLLLFPATAPWVPDSARILHRLQEQGIAGLILGEDWADVPGAAHLAEEAGMPVVLLTPPEDAPPGCSTVSVCEEELVETALSHLWARGHRRIAGVFDLASESDGRCAPHSGPADRTQKRRYQAWGRALSARGVEPGPFLFRRVEDGGWAEEQLARALGEWTSAPNGPTAVFCASDAAGHALLRAARSAGVSLPRDLSVLAMDTEEGQFARTDTPLSSVVFPAEQIGAEAVRLLRSLLAPPGATALPTWSRSGNGGLPEHHHYTVPVSRVAERGSVRTL